MQEGFKIQNVVHCCDSIFVFLFSGVVVAVVVIVDVVVVVVTSVRMLIILRKVLIQQVMHIVC